jgi:hypothetical protein
MADTPPPLRGEEKDAYEAAKERRAAFITDVITRWRVYLNEEGAADAAGNATSTHDRLLHLAINLIDHVRAMEYRGPLSEIRFGEIQRDKTNTLQSIESFCNFDRLTEWSSKDLSRAKATEVHPIELLLGELVSRARSLGASWREIGARMGMTGQGAQKKAIEKGWIGSDELTEGEQE